MPNLTTDINLNSTFALIQKIKQGIKQKCYISITEADIGVSGIGLRITIQTKNYRTNEPIYFQRTIKMKLTLEQHGDSGLHNTIIKKTIDQANRLFKEEQINAVNKYSYFNKRERTYS